MALGVVIFLWYPPPFYQIQGLSPILLMLIGVDLVLGPSLTFIIYKKNKVGLKFDLTVIGLVQISALIYGMYSTFIARPVYAVFYGDRFETVCANEYSDEALKKIAGSPYAQFSWRGPRWVAALMPDDAKEKERIMFSAVIGGGLKLEPQYYVPFDQVKNRALNIGKRADDLIVTSRLASTPGGAIKNKFGRFERPELIRSWSGDLNMSTERIVLIPLKGSTDYGVVAVNADSGDILGARAIDPWWYE